MRLGSISMLLLVALTGFAVTGCNRDDKGSGDSHVVAPPSDTNSSNSPNSASTNVGGTGNAPTSAGTGATNGVVGNETRNTVGGPGNVESGAGTTTRPAD